MTRIPLTPLFDRLDTGLLPAPQRKLYDQLPADYQDFLARHNGGQAKPHTLNFFTGIPFDQPDAALPSRTDFVETFLGLNPAGEEDWDDLFQFNTVDMPDACPEGLILVARGHYGDILLSIAQEDRGVVYYEWRHFPTVAKHYREKRNRVAAMFDDPSSPEAERADELALLERLSGSWTEFMDSFIPEESMDLSEVADLVIMQYDKMYEQIKRRVAFHNIALMLGPDYTKEGLRLLKQVSAGFLPVYWEEEIRHDAPASGELYVAARTLEDDWILDRMLDALMLQSPPDPRQLAIVVHFGQYIGYPLLEIQRSVADYHGKRERNAKRQAPPIHEMIQDGREQALRTIQTLYLIGIAGGEVTPKQDKMFGKIAGEGELDPEELMFIVRHREGLGLMPPLFSGWADDMKKKVNKFLKVDGEPHPASQAKADLFFELLKKK